MSTQTAQSEPTFKEGLEDVVAGQSAICFLDGRAGRLLYFGYDVHDLARNASFEEVVYLLWHGELPTKSQLEQHTSELRENRALPEGLLAMMRTWPREAEPMEALRSGASLLSLWDPDRGDNSRAANLRKSVRLTARLPTVVATFEALRDGREPVKPDPSLGEAESFLYMMTGQRPSEEEAKMLNVSLILHADHELNASTFACRVTIATLSDMYSAVTSGIGTLAGPLHGGANTAVMNILLKVDREYGGTPEHAVEYVSEMLGRREKIMGFGHRVYRTEDPRATWLRRFSEEPSQKRNEDKWYQMSKAIEVYMKSEKGLWANVDFYSASVHYLLNIPPDQFTPFFAVSRVSGWTAHCLEQLDNNRLIRPRAEYIGPEPRDYQPIDKRG
jgi:citrate synthase